MCCLKTPPMSPVCAAGVESPHAFHPGAGAVLRAGWESQQRFFPWNIRDGYPCDEHRLLPSSPRLATHARSFTQRNGKGFRMESFILMEGFASGGVKSGAIGLMCTTPPWGFAGGKLCW